MRQWFERYEDWCFEQPALVGFFFGVVLPVMLYVIGGALLGALGIEYVARRW